MEVFPTFVSTFRGVTYDLVMYFGGERVSYVCVVSLMLIINSLVVT